MRTIVTVSGYITSTPRPDFHFTIAPAVTGFDLSMPPKRAKQPHAAAVPKPAAVETRARGRKARSPEVQQPAAAVVNPLHVILTQLGQILNLLQTRVDTPAPPSQPVPLQPVVQTDPVPATIASTSAARDAFNSAMHTLDSRLPASEGSIDITDFLNRGAKRKVREGSIDLVTFQEFVYAFIGYATDSSRVSPEQEPKLTFLRQITEDASQYNWRGVLDWAMTVIDRINAKNIRWDSSQEIAMDRLVVSRSVANTSRPTTIACPEYNLGECPFKTSHTEGRFKLAHACGYCLLSGAEYPHTEKACNRKKGNGGYSGSSGSSSGGKSNTKSRYGSKNSDGTSDNRSD